jgi:hypothetical protein
MRPLAGFGGTNNFIQTFWVCSTQTSVGGQSQLSDFEALLPVEKDATARALDRCRRVSGEIAHSLEIIPKRWVDGKILAELCASLEIAAEILQSTEERR